MLIQTLTKSIALALLLLASCQEPESVAAESSPQPSVASLAQAEVLASGSFSGLNDHVVTGGVQLLQDGGRTYLQFDDAFSLDGAPDPKVGFGRKGTYDTTSTLGALRDKQGSQAYELPDGFTLGTLDEAYIWCEDFSVPLGVASLQP